MDDNIGSDIRELRSSIETLGATLKQRDAKCIRHDEINKEQQRINVLHAEQIARLQDSGFGIQEIVIQLGAEFKEERNQTREAINSIAQALERNEKLQGSRHEKTLEVQQKNLEANVSLLKIFQDHQIWADKNIECIEDKIVASKVSYKALTGLGLGMLVMLTGFFSSMIWPPFDAALHAAAGLFIKLLPWHW